MTSGVAAAACSIVAAWHAGYVRGMEHAEQILTEAMAKP